MDSTEPNQPGDRKSGEPGCVIRHLRLIEPSVDEPGQPLALTHLDRARGFAVFLADIVEAGTRQLGPRNPSSEHFLQLAAELRAAGSQGNQGERPF